MNRIPFKSAEILVPKDINMQKWSVVACDQYTSQPEYWGEVKSFVGSAPSTLNMIFPEVYLNDDDAAGRIKSINKTMNRYLGDGIFRRLENSLVYVERTVGGGKVRRGIVGSVDLEAYNYNKGSRTPIRATEGTVLERIPPRVKIRKNAVLELPHIMLLIDDPEFLVEKSVDISRGEKIYDFDLMKNSGHITGYRIKADKVISALIKLDRKITDKSVPLFAVGDGNHSLATAKACWEQIKKNLTPAELENHPARFPLVEIVNVHDDALVFEPIHRVVFGCDPEKLVSELKSRCTGHGEQKIRWITADGSGEVITDSSVSSLAVGTLQSFLDEYTEKNGGTVDYIHGADVVEKLAKEPGNAGFLLPVMEKSQLFKTVAADGALPRKTFSMGEAWEKRFYVECKQIVK